MLFSIYIKKNIYYRLKRNFISKLRKDLVKAKKGLKIKLFLANILYIS